MTIAMPNARRARGQRRPPRVNSPVRRQPRAGSMPDVVLTLSFAALTMAAVFFFASFGENRIATGEAGPGLARLFAASLGVVAFAAFLLGLMLLQERLHLGARFVYACMLGIVIGLLQTAVFLEAPGILLGAPPVLALVAVRPARERVLRGVGLMPRGDML